MGTMGTVDGDCATTYDLRVAWKHENQPCEYNLNICTLKYTVGVLTKNDEKFCARNGREITPIEGDLAYS